MDDNRFLSAANPTYTRPGGDSADNRVEHPERAAGPKLGKAASALFSEAAFNAPANEGPDLGKVLERGDLARKGRGL